MADPVTVTDPGMVTAGLGMVKEFIGTLVPLAAGVIGFVLLLLAFIQDGLKTYRLLYRHYARSGRSAALIAGWKWLNLFVRDGTFLKIRSKPLLRRAKVLIERDMFYDAIAPDGGAPGKRRKAWRRQTWKAVNRQSPAFEVVSPRTINERFGDIRDYFADLKDLAGGEDGLDEIFANRTEVRSGFIAPIHLLTGLLAEFNDKWDPIIAAFDRDAGDIGGMFGGKQVGRDNRQIQMFIYNCWLLWGPSIPVCGCNEWKARFQVVQYGFGDENNSIEVVGKASDISQSLESLADSCTGMVPMALPARVSGYLTLSGNLPGSDRERGLPNAVLTSWKGKQDERPVLFVSEQVFGDTRLGKRGQSMETVGSIDAVGGEVGSRYYSAYLWIAFEIQVPVGRKGDEWEALSASRGRSEPWKDLIPFFEHGNLADPESCRFGKQQLAVKAVNAVFAMVRSWVDAGWTSDEGVPHRLAFIGAIDETGCGLKENKDPFRNWRGGTTTVREMMREELDRRAKDQYFAAVSEVLRLDAEISDRLSTCLLPAKINLHYDTMDAG